MLENKNKKVLPTLREGAGSLLIVLIALSAVIALSLILAKRKTLGIFSLALAKQILFGNMPTAQYP